MTRRGTGVARPFPGDAADAHGLHRACVDYLDWIEVHNYSPRTVVGFGASLAVFVGWCAERGVARPAEVTRPVLERYERHLVHHRKPDGTPLSNRTQYGRLVAIRGLFRFLVRHNRILSNPASDLEGHPHRHPPRRRQPPPPIGRFRRRLRAHRRRRGAAG